MKKVIYSFVLICAVTASGSAVLSAEDFYGADWGMKMNEVELDVNGELTYYDGDAFTVLGTDIVPVYGREAVVVFYFSHPGNLVKGGYFFRPEYPAGVMYKSDYDRLVDIMVGQFGEPQERLMWHTKWYYDPNEYMKAVKNGDLTMMSFWESDRSYIELSLSGDQSGYNLSLQFFSKDLYGEYVDMLLEQALAEQETQDDLGSGEAPPVLEDYGEF